MEILLIVAFAVTFVFLLKISGKSRQERYLESVPGPAGYPIIGNFFDIFQNRQNFLKFSVENAAKFGSVYKLWIGSTPIVFISKPEYVQTLFSTKGITRRPDENSVITKSVKIHPFNCPRKRNIIASAVNTRKPDSIIKITNDNCQTLLNALKPQKNVILESKTLSLCILDIICEIILGVNLNTQSGKNSSFEIALLQLSKLSERNHKIRFYKDSLFRMISHGKEYFGYLNIIQEFIHKIIEDRERDGHSQNETNILDEMLIYKGIYTIEEIQNEILNLIISAFELTNPSVYSLLYTAAHRSEVQDKILNETGAMDNENLTLKDLQRMSYLDRVVKETLRVFPPCPFVVKETERDVKIGNHVIPYGTTICIQLLNIHRNPDSFLTPEAFDPDNFLPRNTKAMTRWCYTPFGIADGICLGQKPTEIIQRVVFINILRTFSVETVEQSNENFASIGNYINQSNRETKLRLKLRSKK